MQIHQRRLAHCLAACGTILLGWTAIAAASEATGGTPRGRNLLAEPGFEASDGWTLLGTGARIDSSVAHSGRSSLCCSNRDIERTSGAARTILLDPPVRHPFRISGWSKAQGAEVAQDYNVYLDLEYADGTPLWGQIARFQPGTHDWQRTELVFDVAKPVRKISVFVFLRKAKGTVWFDDLRVELLPLEFRSLSVSPEVYGPGTVGVFGTVNMAANWHVQLTSGSRLLAQASSRDAGDPIRFDWTAPTDAKPGDYVLQVRATDAIRGETVAAKRAFRLGPSAEGRGYAVWTESSMRRVMPSASPPSGASEGRCQAKVALARGEYESFQILLLPPLDGQPLEDVRIEVSDLLRHGGGRIPADQIHWHQVGYVRVDKLRPHPADLEASPGWWPDPLLPVARLNVPPGFAQAVWVTVQASSETPPGEYTGRITIRPANRLPAEVEVRTDVYGFEVPARGHLKTAFALMDGFLERVYGRPLSAGLRQQYGDFLLRHRLNPDDISRTDPPAIEDLLHYKNGGLNAFNVLNLVEERGDRTWVCWSPLSVYTPEFKQRLTDRLDPYVRKLRENTLVDRAYVYTFDERGEDFYPVMREYFGMIKNRYPEIPTLTTAKVPQDPEVMRRLNVDWNCPLTPAYRFEDAEKCRAAGLQVWAYVCMGPGYPYANWLADHPLIESRLIWWQAFQEKTDGMLYWGVNIWSRQHNDRPIDPASGPLLEWSITTGGDYDWLHGDGILLYPGIDGPIGSIRLANLRDGLEDYEYLWLLGRQAGNVDVAREACVPVSRSLTEFGRDPQALTIQRDAIARRIALQRGSAAEERQRRSYDDPRLRRQ